MNKPNSDPSMIGTEGWETINWRKVERYVFKLQKRIYAASRQGDKRRVRLTGQLKLTGKSKPTRRVWIPKPGKDEKRPLGIPTMVRFV